MGERWYREQLKPSKTRNTATAENFGAVCEPLREGGFIPIPLDGKKPVPKRWSGLWLQPPNTATYANWKKQHGNANVGVCTGEVVAIDIDEDVRADADKAQEKAFSVLGATPFIRIGRTPRRTCFYRLNYEDARQTASWKVGKVELLADGKQCAVFGIHPDTGKPFTWPNRSIIGVSVTELPLTTADALIRLRKGLESPEEEEPPEQSTRFAMDHIPAIGERDKFLFWFAKESAATANSIEALTQVVLERNASFPSPLPIGQATGRAKSAWKYKEEGKLLLSGTNAPTVIPAPRIAIEGLIRQLDPQAAKLLIGLAATRHTAKEFTIPQAATAEAFNMSVGSLKKGLRQLIKLGLLIYTGKNKRSVRYPRPAKVYRFGSGGGDQGDKEMSRIL